MKMVSKMRKTELHHLRNFSYLNASFAFTFTCAPFLVSNDRKVIIKMAHLVHCFQVELEFWMLIFAERGKLKRGRKATKKTQPIRSGSRTQATAVGDKIAALSPQSPKRWCNSLRIILSTPGNTTGGEGDGARGGRKVIEKIFRCRGACQDFCNSF